MNSIGDFIRGRSPDAHEDVTVDDEDVTLELDADKDEDESSA